MPLPLVHLLEEPNDNEIKLWHMLRQMRMGLIGQGGPLSGWGFSSGDDGGGSGGFPGEVVYLGLAGQLTVDGTGLLFEDTTNKRVGVNTFVPAYPLDIHSNECDPKIISLRTGNEDGDIDMFANFDVSPGARIRLSRTDDGVADPTFALRFYQNVNVAEVNTLHERLSLSEVVDVKSGFALSGDITPAQITSNQNNYNPTGLDTATVVRLSSDAARSITGLAGGVDGAVKLLRNVGSFAITLVNASVSSDAENRFSLGNDVIIPAGKTVGVLYDSTLSRWVDFAGGTTSGSGTANRIAYWVNTNTLGAVGAIAQNQVMFADANGLPIGKTRFIYDTTNDRLGITNSAGHFANKLVSALSIIGSTSVDHATISIYSIDNGATTPARYLGYRWDLGSTTADKHLVQFGGGGTYDDDANPTGSIQASINFYAAEDWLETEKGTYITFETTPIGSVTMTERERILASGHHRFTELATDPGTGDLASLAAFSVYMKNDKFVIAYNNAATITYISIPMDGSTTTWTHSTSAP